MMRVVLMTAGMTGIFCAGFAVFIDWATDMLDRRSVLFVSFASGFLGSIFAQTIIKRWRSDRSG